LEGNSKCLFLLATESNTNISPKPVLQEVLSGKMKLHENETELAMCKDLEKTVKREKGIFII